MANLLKMVDKLQTKVMRKKMITPDELEELTNKIASFGRIFHFLDNNATTFMNYQIEMKKIVHKELGV